MTLARWGLLMLEIAVGLAAGAGVARGQEELLPTEPGAFDATLDEVSGAMRDVSDAVSEPTGGAQMKRVDVLAPMKYPGPPDSYGQTWGWTDAPDLSRERRPAEAETTGLAGLMMRDAEGEQRGFSMNGSVRKLGRGVANTLGGWMEIPLTVDEEWDASHDQAANLFAGAGMGILNGAARTAVGLYEVVTFPLPLPAGYAPILPTLKYFDRTVDQDELPLR